jgi:LemA protein
MKTWMWVVGVLMLFIVLPLFMVASWGVATYNTLQTSDEHVNASFSEVTNQYQRRADLVPSLVSVVQGYATHEKSTLEGIAQARASATSITMTPAMLNNAEAMAKFQAAQSQLSGFLGRLMVASERYPELKADKQFINLESQIEGTENRITVARNRYISAVNDWNVQVRKFPGNMVAGFGGYTVKPNFTVDNVKAIDHAGAINFN